MKTYLVRWEIDLEAKSPRAAAEEALTIQRSISDSTVFEVTETEHDRFGGAHTMKGRTHVIDLGVSE